MKTWYRVALFCGLEPLLVGTLIFIAWLISRARWLEYAGLVNIIAGTCLVWVGLVCLGVYFHQARQQQVAGYLKRSLLALALMVANYPVAITFILTAEYLLSQSTVVVHNQSELSVQAFRLQERDIVYELGDIVPGQTVEHSFHFQHEGSVDYSLMWDGQSHSGVMFGYVTSGLGVTAVMEIDASGMVSVREEL